MHTRFLHQFLFAGLLIFGITSISMGQASLSDPFLSTFSDILFVERSIVADSTGAEYDGDHMCNQYHAFNARKGGGLYLLKNFKSANPQRVDIVAGLKVPSGTHKDMLLSDGAFLSPDLSWDGKTVVFAWTAAAADRTAWVQANRFSLFSVNLDGTNLKRLTDANADDFDPCWLPNDRIVFISNRRGGFGRCHPMEKPTFTLYSMKADGTDLFCIDYHETNEWQPSINNDGEIVYTRWDYIDRDSDIAHEIWICLPDGTNPRSWHGNYPYPWCTLPEGLKYNLYVGDGRTKRPWMEMNIRAIPNTSGKYVATAALHHGQAFGSLVLIDLNVKDDNMTSQLTRLTPEVPFPEAETNTDQSWEIYGTAWPFSETKFLINYKTGMYFYDAGSNPKSKALIYQSTVKYNRPIDPIPVVARTVPPVLTTKTCQGELLKPNSPNATMAVLNVKISDLPFPANTTIKSMRIVQVFPKTTPLSDVPKVNYGTQTLCRMSLGTVPVESDGSVYCKAPVAKEVYFQLLDQNGLAVQSMRSGAYFHSGEQMTCIGCHEDKYAAPPSNLRPIAMQRPPSEISPEPGALEPVNFYRTVKPIFAAKCTPCHTQQAAGPDMSYASLAPYIFYFDGGNGGIMNADSNWGGSRSIPGLFGASYSRLYKGGFLSSAHHGVALADSEFHRIALWIDLNSNELGSYDNVAGQQNGQLVWPTVDVTPTNLQGVENRVITATRNDVSALTAHARTIVTRDMIKLSIPFAGACQVSLRSLNGRVIERASAQGPGIVSLPVRHAESAGIYLLSITSGKGSSSEKIIMNAGAFSR
jgi:hypothetical protein